jgi:hypothetical protein
MITFGDGVSSYLLGVSKCLHYTYVNIYFALRCDLLAKTHIHPSLPSSTSTYFLVVVQDY